LSLITSAGRIQIAAKSLGEWDQFVLKSFDPGQFLLQEAARVTSEPSREQTGLWPEQ
jgi:hypothetical protein